MKRLSPYFKVVLISFLFLACNKEEDPKGACGNDYGNLNHSAHVTVPELYEDYVPPVVPGESIQIFYQGSGVVQFITGANVADVCSKEHMSIHFRAYTASDRTDYPVSLTVFGEAYYGVSSRRIDMTFDKKNREWIGGLDVGLDQQFKDKPGNVDIYTTVEFQSLGSRDKDIAFFNEWFNNMGASCRYSKH